MKIEKTFFHAFPSLQQRLSIFQRLVQGNDFLILIIGEEGSGKTMLLKHFLTVSSSDWQKCRIRARSTGRSANLSLDNLDNHPAYILEDAMVPIVMFDDAHDLTEIELKYLLKDALAPNSNRKLKRLVLFCEPVIKSKLARLSTSIAKETTVNKLYMPQLNEKETSGYLQHRLITAGYKGKPVFKTSQVRAIHNASQGLPLLINQEADKWLSRKYSSDSKTIFHFHKRSFSIGVAVFISVVIFTLYIGYSGQPTETTYENNRVKKLSTDSNLLPGDIGSPPFASTEIETAPLTKTHKKATSRPDEADASDESTIEKKNDYKSPSDQTPVHKTEKTKQKEIRPNSQKHVSKKSSRPSATESDENKARINRVEWILAQNSSHYTIQIVGTRNRDSLIEFIHKYKLTDKAKIAYYRTHYKGAPWYQAIYGIYNNKREAKKAIANLPKEIRRLTPWVRRISSVKSMLNRK